MDRTYNLNELAMMTGFTTRTLRNYLTQGLLHGEKRNGTWQFSAENVERFFAEPYVKEGLRIKRTAAVFDFLADRSKKTERVCVILDLPLDVKRGNKVSAFFCDMMKSASDTEFSYEWDGGHGRVILKGAEKQVAEIMKAYSEHVFSE